MKFQAFARLATIVTALAVLVTVALPPSAGAAERSTPAAEAQIGKIKARLHITAAQEPQWQALAAVMRENARLVRASAADRAKIHPTTIVDKLYADRRATQERLERLERVIPVAEALYAVLTARQKAVADHLFAPPRIPAF